MDLHLLTSNLHPHGGIRTQAGQVLIFAWEVAMDMHLHVSNSVLVVVHTCRQACFLSLHGKLRWTCTCCGPSRTWTSVISWTNCRLDAPTWKASMVLNGADAQEGG